MDNNIINQLSDIAAQKSRNYSDDDFKVRGLWKVDYRYKPNDWERDLSYSMLYAQTIWQGCCYVDYGKVKIDESILGQDAREMVKSNIDISSKIALLDSVFAVFDKKPSATYYIDGSASEKTIRRASIITNEVIKELFKINAKKVLNVGVMGNFIKLLQDCKVDVVGSDFVSVIDASLPNFKIEHGDNTIKLIEEFDVILATGMTLWTQTLEEIMHAVKKHNKKLILFAATGSNFAEEYCNTFGVDVVISEPQPQYMFQGTSTIKVFRK